MSNLHEKILTQIQLFTNNATSEIHHETMFNAVIGTLDNKITRSDFVNFFNGKTGANGVPFTEKFTLILYNEYTWLYDYLLINRTKIKAID